MTHEVMSLWSITPEVVDRMLAALDGGPLSVEALGAAVAMPPLQAQEFIVRLAKFGLLVLSERKAD
jgi:hypothetical protein